MRLELPADFKSAGPIPQESIEGFSEFASDELIQFWSEAGLGSFSDGFMRTVDPVRVSSALVKAFEVSGIMLGIANLVPVFASSFGDLVLYDGHGTYLGFNLNRRRISEVGVRLPYLLHDLQSGFFHREMFSPEAYEKAREIAGEAAVDECYAWLGDTYRLVKLEEFIVTNAGPMSLD